MADGKWTMTDDDARRVDLSFSGSANKNIRNLPNYGQHRYVDNRNGNAQLICAFCGSCELETGFGGYGEGFGYKSYLCSSCGQTLYIKTRKDVCSDIKMKNYGTERIIKLF